MAWKSRGGGYLFGKKKVNLTQEKGDRKITHPKFTEGEDRDPFASREPPSYAEE